MIEIKCLLEKAQGGFAKWKKGGLSAESADESNWLSHEYRNWNFR
jgi:hypothetical protein